MMAIEWAMLEPIIARRAAGESVPPYWAASSLNATSHSFSLSTSVPSMSKSTAAGYWLVSGASKGRAGLPTDPALSHSGTTSGLPDPPKLQAHGVD